MKPLMGSVTLAKVSSHWPIRTHVAYIAYLEIFIPWKCGCCFCLNLSPVQSHNVCFTSTCGCNLTQMCLEHCRNGSVLFPPFSQ